MAELTTEAPRASDFVKFEGDAGYAREDVTLTATVAIGILVDTITGAKATTTPTGLVGVLLVAGVDGDKRPVAVRNCIVNTDTLTEANGGTLTANAVDAMKDQGVKFVADNPHAYDFT